MLRSAQRRITHDQIRLVGVPYTDTLGASTLGSVGNTNSLGNSISTARPDNATAAMSSLLLSRCWDSKHERSWLDIARRSASRTVAGTSGGESLLVRLVGSCVRPDGAAR